MELGLTSNWLSDNGGMVVRMVARVKVMVVQSSMQPVVEKLHRTSMKQKCYDESICSPHWYVSTSVQPHSPYVEQYCIEYNLVIPVQ